jgi:hypothetical protein
MRTHFWLSATFLFLSSLALAHPHEQLTGWQLSSPITDRFEASADTKVTFRGKPTARLQTDVPRADLASLIQSVDAEQYRGKRIRLATYAKTKGVEGWTGAWVRVDSNHSRFRSYEDTHNVNLQGDRDWTALSIVLDIPEDAQTIDFGLSQEGTGTSWFGPVSVETVSPTVKTTYYEGGRNYATGPLSCQKGAPTGSHIRTLVCYNHRTGRTTYVAMPEYGDGNVLSGTKVGTPQGWVWVWG